MFDEQERSEQKLTADLTTLEQQLRGFAPAMPRIDRDKLMFAAGRAAARPEWPGYIAGPSRAGARHWIWPAATATMTAATLLLGTMLLLQREQHSVAQQTARSAPVVEVSTPQDDSTLQLDGLASRSVWSLGSATSGGYLGIRYIALTRGVGALPSNFQPTIDERDLPTDDHEANPATSQGMLQELLPGNGRSNHSRS